MQSGDDVHPVFVWFQSLHRLRKRQPAQSTAFLQFLGDAGQRVEPMVLQKENNPFGSAGDLNHWRVSTLSKVRKQTGAQQRTHTGRHSMKHFSAIAHNENLLFSETPMRLFHFTSTSHHVKASMP